MTKIQNYLSELFIRENIIEKLKRTIKDAFSTLVSSATKMGLIINEDATKFMEISPYMINIILTLCA